MSRFQFKKEIILEWQAFWSRLCTMAYTREDIAEELCVYPKTNNEAVFYERNCCSNLDTLHLDHMWEKYSKQYHEALVVPELKKIHVPRALFECLGVYKWFEYSFPNCEITFWE